MVSTIRFPILPLLWFRFLHFLLDRERRFPLLVLVTMRGEWGEFNPWQVPMGATTEAAFRLMEAGLTIRAAGRPAAVIVT